MLDVSVILQLIRELAAYEHSSDKVQATEESLLNNIAFADSTNPSSPIAQISRARPARVLLLLNPAGEAAGMALYFYNYSTWRAAPGIYLEDLFVRESERKNGYGHRLLSELAKEVVAMDGGRLEWSVLRWNTPSIEFYERIGAKAMNEWFTMRVDGEALVRLASSERAGSRG